MRFFISTIIILFSCKIVDAQAPHTCNLKLLSIDEMISIFYKYSNKNILCDSLFFDPFVGYTEIGISIVVDTPLKNYSDTIIRNCHAKWRISHKNKEDILYLEKILPIGITPKEAEKRYAIIQNMYGKYDTYSGVFGIPAKWFTGKITILNCPRKIFNETVAKDGFILTLKDGGIISRELIHLKEGLYESSCHATKGGGILITEDGCWWQHISINTDSLNNAVNKGFHSSKNDILKDYSFLLIINPSSGKLSLHPLWQKQPNTVDIKNIDYLKKIIEQLPAWSYGPLITANKKLMYGRYFKASLSKTGWKLEDYLLE